MAFQTQRPNANLAGLSSLVKMADPFSALGKTMNELDTLVEERRANEFVKGVDTSSPENLLSAFTSAPNEKARNLLGENIKNISALNTLKNQQMQMEYSQEINPLKVQQTQATIEKLNTENEFNKLLQPTKVEQTKTEWEMKKKKSEADLNKTIADTKKTLSELDNTGGLTVDKKIDNESKLRGEWQKVMGDHIKVNEAYEKMNNINTSTAPGQMSLVFSYMKMLDPGSTVREGEFANASNATGVSGKVMNIYNGVLNGNMLTDTQIKEFKEVAQNLATSSNKKASQYKDTLMNTVNQYGLNENNIFGEYAKSLSKPVEKKEKVNKKEEKRPPLSSFFGGK